MPAKEIAIVFIFRSESSPGKSYQALQYVDGSTSCECPGWKFKRKSAERERTCKHTRWIDCGLAERHAEGFTRYAQVAARPRARVLAGASESQPELRSMRSRVIILD